VRYYNRSGGRSSSISTAAFFSLGPFRTSFCVDLVCCPFSFGAELSVPHCASVAGAVLRICCTAYVIFSDFHVLMFAKSVASASRLASFFVCGNGNPCGILDDEPRTGYRSSQMNARDTTFFSGAALYSSHCRVGRNNYLKTVWSMSAPFADTLGHRTSLSTASLP